MKVVEINSANYGSTGKIMLGIADIARENGISYITACPDGRSMRKKTLQEHIFIGNIILRNFHLIMSKITGLNGCFSIIDTYRFLKRLEKEHPDVLHLHNLHNGYINLKMLFSYIKKNNIKVIWTLHDCWSFTGQCPYFSSIGCEKWKTGCQDCSQYREYPEAYVDRSKKMWRLKKKWFTGVKDMTIVTPSQWLADLVKESFLQEYPVKVINNGIDLTIFKPTESDFREKHNIKSDDYMILGVASAWEPRKGLDVFLEMAEQLDDRFKIVLVGTNDEVDKLLPEKVISVHRTNNAQELAAIYTAADLFVIPTREDNYPTVNLEAIACGTPVLTFRTGGSPESIDEKTGSVVPCDDIDGLIKETVSICTEKRYSKEDCISRGLAFDQNDRFKEYLDLYE